MSAIERIDRYWGDSAPEWVIVLAEDCDRRSQKQVAQAIGYSAAVVNTVLSRTYKGDWGAVEQAVSGALLHVVVQCPVAGELAAHQCLEYQRQPFRATNAQRVRLYKACQVCPNNRKNQSGGA